MARAGGGVFANGTRVSGRDAAAGTSGERATARWLASTLAGIPNTYVFHGLSAPGLRSADIDHVVVFGSTMILIDTKMWPAGTYLFAGPLALHGLLPWKEGRTNTISIARRNFPAALGRQNVAVPAIDTLLLVWGPRNKKQSVVSICPSRFQKAARPTRRLASQLQRAARRAPAPPDPNLLGVLRSMVKRGG